MTKIENKIIVWGIDDFNTLGLMRELGQFELDLLFLIKGSKGFASQSKYCKNFIETKNLDDGYEYLINNYSNCTNKPIVIVSGDDVIVYIDKHKKELDKFFILPGCSLQGDTEKYTDKNTMTDLALKIGILSPKSKYLTWETNIDDVEYPCLIKPSHERPNHYNEFKTKICKKKSELKRVLKYVHHDSVFILQELIKKEKDILVYGCRMKNGKIELAGAMIRDRFADSGSASHGIMSPNIPKCVNASKIIEFVEKIDYFGLFSFEYGMVGDKAYFFEVNLRNDGTSHYFFQAGANLPLAYVYSCVGIDYSNIPTKLKEEKWFIDELFDYENVLHKRINKTQWKEDMKNATVFKYYDKDDLAPWKTVKKGRKKQILKDILLKKYRLYIVFFLNKIGFKKI